MLEADKESFAIVRKGKGLQIRGRALQSNIADPVRARLFSPEMQQIRRILVRKPHDPYNAIYMD